jgi:hypothetical protein
VFCIDFREKGQPTSADQVPVFPTLSELTDDDLPRRIQSGNGTHSEVQ